MVAELLVASCSLLVPCYRLLVLVISYLCLVPCLLHLAKIRRRLTDVNRLTFYHQPTTMYCCDVVQQY